MAHYQFFIIGMKEALILEVAAETLRELKEMVATNRFIEGEAYRPEEAYMAGVLISTARIQVISEVRWD